MGNKILSIVIPTYNRNYILNKTLNSLLHSINNDDSVEIIILDNASDTPVSSTIDVSYYGLDKVQIIRNKFNIGGNANIASCFLYANSKYIWILGDDDTPKLDCIKKIKSALKKYPDCILYNFNSCGYEMNSSEVLTHGCVEFLESIKYLNKVMFISDCIYNVDEVSKNLRFSFFYQITCAPIICALLIQLKENGRVFLWDEKIVEYDTAHTPIETQMSVIPIALGLPKLLELPISYPELILLQRLITNAYSTWITPKHIANQVLLTSFRNNKTKEGILILKKLRKNSLFYKNRYSVYVLYFISAVFLKFPKIGKRLYLAIYSYVKRKKIDLSISETNINHL